MRYELELTVESNKTIEEVTAAIKKLKSIKVVSVEEKPDPNTLCYNCKQSLDGEGVCQNYDCAEWGGDDQRDL